MVRVCVCIQLGVHGVRLCWVCEFVLGVQGVHARVGCAGCVNLCWVHKVCARLFVLGVRAGVCACIGCTGCVRLFVLGVQGVRVYAGCACACVL